jgi:hypothetical protein
MPKAVHRPRRGHGLSLLERILETPDIARVVPQLPPEMLHRVIERCGLEACGELMALATPEQVSRVLDLDLWRAAQPGVDEQFDADRFGRWLEVLMEAGDGVAARTLAGMDVDLLIAALGQSVRVFDVATLSSVPGDGEEPAEIRPVSDGPDCELGGYLIVAGRTDSWDAIVGVLAVLEAEHHDHFHRVMRGCRLLSNAGFEVDGLDHLLSDREQSMFDLASDRERRREEQGYVTPAEARAFLQMSRQIPLSHSTAPAANPIAGAYWRAIEPAAAVNADRESNRLQSTSDVLPAVVDSAAALASVVDLLLESGVLAQPPRALLEGGAGPASRLAALQAQMGFAHSRDANVYSMRSQELAYLANTIVAGCSLQSRTFTAQEAADAAAAVCNLGLENWPVQWRPVTARRGGSAGEARTALPDDFLVNHDLISVFQVGWTVLHDEVSQYAAAALIAVLAGLRCDDREIQAGLDSLRREMATHWQAGTPWHARNSLDVILTLDAPAWATLLGLIDECPVLHAAIGASRNARLRTIGISDFEFISENSQIASVREFMESLPEALSR